MAPPPSPTAVDPRSGFCKSNSTFYSKRKPVPLPPNDSLDVTTFISSQAHRGHIAFIDAATGRHLTYSQLWIAVDSVSSSLSDMGIKKGHVILILSPNSISFPVVCLAIMSLGAIITTTNPLNTTREITKQIADSKPVLAFTTRELLPKLAGFASNNIVLMDSADQQTKNKSSSNKKVLTLAEMMNRPPTSGRFRETVSQNDTATLLYSSGTTGASKGVVSSHRNLIATVRTVLGRFFSQAEEEQVQTFLCTVPMFHIYGLATFVTGFLTSGSTIVILSKFDMHDMLSAIGKYRVTYLPLVPPILVELVNGAAEIKAKYDLSSLRSALSGGAPLSKEVIEGFLEKFPTVSISQGSILMYAATILGELPRLRAVLTGSNENWVSVKGYYPRTSKTLKKKKKKSISQGYGLTETTGVGASTDTLEESRRYGTAGMLSPSMEAKIVDPDSGEALTVNKTGELWLKGPTIMKGYFCNDDATASTLDSEGWLRTGDLCYIDDDGFIFVVDRLKELIKYKAFQVPPAELESLLLTHPQIADAAVIPFPDEKVGQFPMAYVVRKAGSNLSETAVMDFIAKQVAPYKRIRKVAFIASVPKNPSGKILRKDLIQLATKSPKL